MINIILNMVFVISALLAGLWWYQSVRNVFVKKESGNSPVNVEDQVWIDQAQGGFIYGDSKDPNRSIHMNATAIRTASYNHKAAIAACIAALCQAILQIESFYQTASPLIDRFIDWIKTI